MRLCDALREKKMDLRLRDCHLAGGNIVPQDIQNYLQSLEDDASNCLDIFLSDKKERDIEGGSL